MTTRDCKAVIKRHLSGVIEHRELKRYFVVISNKVFYQYVTSTRNTEDMVNILLEMYKNTMVKSEYGFYVPANIRIIRIDKDGPALVHGKCYRRTIRIMSGRRLIILPAA